RASEILFQLNQLRFGEEFWKLKHVLETRAAKRIDGLAFVAYYGNVVMRGCHQSYNLRLQTVGVLIFIYHYVAILFRESLAQLLILFQRITKSHEQVVVGEHLALALVTLKSIEQLF